MIFDPGKESKPFVMRIDHNRSCLSSRKEDLTINAPTTLIAGGKKTGPQVGEITEMYGCA